MSKIKELFSKTISLAKKRPLTATVITVLILLLINIILPNFKMMERIEPETVSFTVSNINATRVSTNSEGKSSLSTPDSLYIRFSEDISFMSEDDNAALKDIKITPVVDGKWSWNSSSRLVFKPAKDWPEGQNYKVTLPKTIVRSNADEPKKLNTYNFDFSTPEFQRTLKSFKLQQDPTDPKIYNIIAEFTFNFPVNTEEFEKTVSLELDGKKVAYTFIYDDLKRFGTLNSDRVKITTEPQLAKLKLAKYKASSETEKVLDIPSSDKFFRFDSVSSQIVRDDKDNPGQILIVSFTDSLSEKELKGKVKAYALPYTNKYLKDRKKNSETTQTICNDEEECDCYYDEDTDDEECTCSTVNVCREVNSGGSYYSSSAKWIPSDITPEILQTLKPVALEAVPLAGTYDKTHTFKYAVDNTVNDYIYVVVSAPLTSSSGFEIKKSNAYVVSVPAYPKELKVVGNGSLLAMGGSKKLSFVSRNLDGIKVELARILPGRINHFVSQTGGDFENPYFKDSYYFNENDISEKFEKVISLKKEAIKPNYSSLDLEKYIAKGKTGLFLLKSYGYDPKNKYSTTSTSKRFILVTNLGILTKKDIEDNTRVYVMSINTGSPVAGAQVEVIGRNGLPLFTKYTNAQGYADFPSLNGFSNEKAPVAYVAKLGEDLSFIPVYSYDRGVNYSRFDTGGIYYSSFKQKGLTAYMFTDRGLYRPGDNINIGAIVKTPEWSTLAGIPVKVTVTNPRGKTIFERRVSLNSEGFTDFSINTDYTYPTGDYYAYIYDVTNERYPVTLGNVSLRLEEFQEDKLRINAQIMGGTKQGWQPLEGLSAQVKLENLFGTPAKGNRIRADVSLSPLSFYFAKYKDYKFDDPYKGRTAVPSSGRENLFDTQADEGGIAKGDINLGRFAGGSYRLTLDAAGYEQESGASVSTSDSVLVSPNRYLVGYKSANSLNYLKRNTEAKVDFIAIDPDLNQIDLSKLKTKLIQIQNVSTLVKQYNGTYKYQSITKEEEKQTKDFKIAKTGASYTLDTTQPGQYALEVYDEFNQKLTRVTFFVAGSANLTYSLEKDAELSVKLQKEEVAPGEDLVFNIITPYTGSGLITIEREKVYAQKWFTTTSTSSQQSIRVPADFEGNGYINVSFIRAVDSADVFSAPHSYAVVPFYVKRDKRRINIKLDAPTLVKPGDELEIKYSADKASKIVIYGVNEGILQVANYSMPKPLNHFFKKIALEVKTRQILDLILPDFKIVRNFAATGGDEEYDELAYSKDALAEGLNPFARKRDEPVVFWSGLLNTDSKERTYTYIVPSYFNGELRIMAVAASSEATGEASTKTTVRAPIILMPGNPYVAAPGDSFDANIRIVNNKKDSVDGKIDLTLTPSEHLQVIGDNKMSLTIPYGDSKTVSFKVKALDKLGSASLTYSAIHQNPKDTMTAQSTLSVRPPTVYSTILTTGNFEKVPQELKGFQRDMYPYAVERNMFISNSPLVVAKGLETYFRQYPHGCTEQITSQVFPFLALGTVGGNSIIERANVDKSFKQAQEKIKRRQLNNGAFTLWDNGSYEDKTVTLYVMHFFTDAKDLGYSVDPAIMEQGIKRLDDYASKYPTSDNDAYNIAFANYLLARNGKVVTNYLMRTEEYLNKNQPKWMETLTGAYIASTYALLKDNDKASKIINSFKPEGKKYTFYSDYDSTSIRNGKYMYLIGKHFPTLLNKHADIIKALIGAVQENNYNTMSSAATIMALTAYSEGAQTKDASIKVTGIVSKDSSKELKLNTDGFPKAEFGADVQSMSVNSPDIGPLGLYYIISTQGFDKNPKDTTISKGLDVVREYKNDEGKVVKEAVLGQELTVSIKIKSTDKSTVTNIALTDLLPGAFEIISGSISGSTDFYDMREDRALIYLSASKNIKEITYRVKVIASGDYIVPALHAQSLYDNEIYATAKSDRITVKPAN
ncbi:hypothetical protein Dip510_001811 [Elusimicrobium posterum]|uniref:MG2 domain-containing protein n=1 Tax=Elusimicrobium posterum TaxID=3116653 RepID=UPI003C7134C9